MGFEKATDFLSIVTKKYGLQRQAKACLVCERVRNLIASEYAHFLNDWIPHKFEDGVLFIRVKNSSASSELFLQTHTMMEKLNQYNLGEVEDIRIVRKISR